MRAQYIRNNIYFYQSQMDMVYRKIRRLEEARVALSGVDTKVDYTLKSHEHIKSFYHLDGAPYAEMAQNEKEVIKELSAYWDNTKELFISEIDRKLSHHRLTIGSYQNSINILLAALAAAEAEED